MFEENKIVTTHRGSFTFDTTKYSGEPLLDTRVKFLGNELCWITYSDIDNFVREFNEVIDKYRI